MRLYQYLKTVISKDNLSTPVDIRYSSGKETIDTTNITKSITHDITLPIGTTSLDLGGIAQVKFFEFKATADCEIHLDAEVIYAVANKPISMWTKTYSAIDIVCTVSTDISAVIAG